MIDKHITVDSIRWHSVLPCLHLLRAAQLALRVRVTLLALVCVSVFALGQLAILRLPFHSHYGTTPTVLGVLNSKSVDSQRFDLHPQGGHNVGWLVWPWLATGQPGRQLFFQQPRMSASSWSTVATHWTDLLWSLLICGVLGGAISRTHAIRFAREESLSPIKAVRFTGRLWQSYLYAPLLPFLGVGVLSLAGWIVGRADAWLAGGNGGVLMVMGWLPLLASLAMALLLLLILASWPLMVVAISVEGSDGFDGLSRAMGYVMNRPWYFLFLVIIAVGVGLLTDYFVLELFALTARLSEWSIGASDANAFSVWKEFLKLVHLAVLVSYFWSSMTVIYFLLRQSDDGTPLDEVYIPGPPPKPEPLPLVGVAASQQPVIERPATETGGPAQS